MDMLEVGATAVTDRRPTLLVLNKKDLIKPGEIAKKKEVFAFVPLWSYKDVVMNSGHKIICRHGL